MKYEVGDKIITRKNHPCGGNEWLVTRTGADVKLKCLTCGSIVMLDAVKLEKRIKSVIARDKDGDAV